MDVRRPLQTSPLGVPDFEFPRALAAKALGIVGNKKWVSVPTIIVTALHTTFQVAASLSMVASTGRFRARAMGYVENADAGNHTFFDGMSHGTGVIVPTYEQAALIIPPSGEASMATMALVIDFPTVGFTAAPGSTTVFNLLVSCDSASHISLLPNAVQFEIEEY